MKLNYPPIKYPKLKTPDKLIHHRLIGGCLHDFSISTTSKPFVTGTLICTKAQDSFRNESKDSLFISLIEVSQQRQGIGTDLLNLATRFSRKLGLDGRIFLDALPTFTPNEVPHIFYRKFGMSTTDENLNKKLDFAIQNKSNITSKDFPSVYMYYPSHSEKDKNI